MPAGDLVVKPVQYEYMGVLMGTGSNIVVKECEGLDSLPDLRTDDQDRSDDHGSIPGLDLMGARYIDMTIAVNAASHADVTEDMRTLARAMHPRRAEVPFVYMRPGEEKKQCFVRPRKRNFPSNSDMAAGLANGSMMWMAPDPRIYSFELHSMSIVLPAGDPGGSTAIEVEGDFRTAPWFTIEGAGSNPRIEVSGQDEDVDGYSFNDRTVAFDLITDADDVFAIDSKRRTAELNGVNAFQTRRNDNQWWELMPGINTITFSRTNTVGQQVLTMWWRSAWL